MKIYLDIYGTVVTPKEHTLKPANHIREFLEHVLEHHDVYWLSTHCDGDTAEPVNYLSQYLPEDVMPLVKQVKPTSWARYKTEAVNFNEEFLWFDDTLNPYDKRVLEEEGKMDSFVHVKLHENPDLFRDFLNI